MPLPVVDRSSNAEEQIVQAAQVIGRSAHRRDVFQAIYRGKKRVKSVPEIARTTRLTEKQVLIAGRRLADGHVVTQVGRVGSTGYRKIAFFQPYYRRILQLAADPRKRASIPTKRRPAIRSAKVRIDLDRRALRRVGRARRLTVDDIDSFSRVRRVRDSGSEYTEISETCFKSGIGGILGELGVFKDWGGELRDLSSTKVKIKGRRRATAFAFKGPGERAKLLTPGKMGQNGDQIQRLMRCPVDVFIVQYWAQIDDSIVEQLEKFAQGKAVIEGRDVLYGVIDGDDSNRIISAYPRRFPGVTVK